MPQGPMDTLSYVLRDPNEAADELDALRDAMEEVSVTLRHARVFIDSRQRMHSEGVKLYDELLSRLIRVEQGSAK